MLKINPQDALNYHCRAPPAKSKWYPPSPSALSSTLALAYSPGVAEPCKAIAANPDDVYKYTAKGNLVAVISNGTAVLAWATSVGAAAGDGR